MAEFKVGGLRGTYSVRIYGLLWSSRTDIRCRNKKSGGIRSSKSGYLVLFIVKTCLLRLSHMVNNDTLRSTGSSNH